MLKTKICTLAALCAAAMLVCTACVAPPRHNKSLPQVLAPAPAPAPAPRAQPKPQPKAPAPQAQPQRPQPKASAPRAQPKAQQPGGQRGGQPGTPQEQRFGGHF